MHQYTSPVKWPVAATGNGLQDVQGWPGQMESTFVSTAKYFYPTRKVENLTPCISCLNTNPGHMDTQEYYHPTRIFPGPLRV